MGALILLIGLGALAVGAWARLGGKRSLGAPLLIGGGAAAVASIPLLLFAPANSCGETLSAAPVRCQDNVSSRFGNTHAIALAEGGRYRFEVIPPPGKKFPLDARVILSKASGDVIADEFAAAAGKPAIATANLKPGAYVVAVKDAGGVVVTGGFDYTLKIDKHPVAEGPAGKAEARLVESIQTPEKQPAQKNAAALTISP
jgi:hypothetical protein